MKSELAKEFLQMVETEVQSRHSAIVFEIAYQARIAADRIKFAIEHTEHFASRSDPAREANMQLLDALDRLQSAERHFQQMYRSKDGATRTMGSNGDSLSGKQSSIQNGSEVQSAISAD